MVVFTEPCGRVVVNIRNIEAPPRCPRLIFIEGHIVMFPFFSVIFTILLIRDTQVNRSIITSTKVLKAFPMCCHKIKGYLKVMQNVLLGKTLEPPSSVIKICNCGEHDYIAFDEYYNEPIGRSFGNCDIYNTTITWLRKHDHMARYFPIFVVFGAKFQYFDNGE